MNDDNLILIGDSRPVRADALKNRALLLDTAKRLFAQHGVDAVCMSAIAEAAGVGKGTLYRHFNNKTELCEALLDEDQRDLQSRTLTHLRRSGDPVECLHWFLKEVLAFVDRNSPFMRAETNRSASLAFPAHWWWHQTIRGLLERIQPPGNVDYLADVLYIMLDVNTLHFQRQVHAYSLDYIANGLLATADQLIGL